MKQITKDVKQNFSRFVLRALGVWVVVSALLISAHVWGGTPFGHVMLAIGLMTLAVALSIHDNYSRLPRLPKGFVIIGRHLITPAGVYCRECHIPSKINERIPYRDDASKTFIRVYKCPDCGAVDYIDESRIDKESKK